MSQEYTSLLEEQMSVDPQVSAMSTPKVMAQVSQHDTNGQPAAGLSYTELGSPSVSTSTPSTFRSSKRPKLSAPRLSRPFNLRMDVSGSDSLYFEGNDPVLTLNNCHKLICENWQICVDFFFLLFFLFLTPLPLFAITQVIFKEYIFCGYLRLVAGSEQETVL